jgi:GT2 family glycosyltransferase
VPGPETLREHVESHRLAGGPAVVVGSLPFPEDVRRDSFLWYLERSGHYDLYEHPDKYPGGRPPLPPLNGNSSLPRELFESVGGYDEGFRQYGGEDLELGHRLARREVRFIYNPRAVGVHHHIKGFPRFCEDMERAGESLILIYRKYPEIKVPKKIDVVTDPPASLPPRKRLMRTVLSITLAAPWLLSAPRLIVATAGRFYAMRYPLFPFYRWIAFTHYAIGMRRELSRGV